MPTQTTAIVGFFQAISSSFCKPDRMRPKKKPMLAGGGMKPIDAIGFSYACFKASFSPAMKGGAGLIAGIAAALPAAARQSRKVR
jgi:hypothetical protein